MREKQQKLKNPLFFVSQNRLSVRNLHRDIDDQELRNLFQRAASMGVKEGKVSAELTDAELRSEGGRVTQMRVMQAKVMRDLDKPKDEETNRYRSKCFGFVVFNEHVYALAALRTLNNNPAFCDKAMNSDGALKRWRAGGSNRGGGPDDNATPLARLIVDFAVENRSKMKLQVARREAADRTAARRGGERSAAAKLAPGAAAPASRAGKTNATGTSSGSTGDAGAENSKRRKARPDSETRKKRRVEAEERKLPARAPPVPARDTEGPAQNKRKKRPKVRKRKRGPQLDRDEAATESKINQYKSRLFGGGGGWFSAVDGDA